MTSGATPLVSVVVPAYNAGAYLRPAVESVLGQTCEALEVVVVDDGSTDGSIATIEGLGDPRLRILRQANAGKPAALNRALDEIRGKLVAIQDADDLSKPTRIERQARHLLANPGLAGVLCGWELIIDGRHLAPRFAHRGVEQCRRDVEALRMPGHDATVMYRRSSLGGLRFDSSLAIGEGLDFLLRVGEMGDLEVLGECLYAYRIVSTSLTHADAGRRERLVAEALRRARRRRGMPDAPRPRRAPGRRPPTRDNNLPAHFMESVLDQRRAGRRRAAVRTALECARLRPGDPRYHKALVYSVAPEPLLRVLRRRVRRAEGPRAR